MKSYCKLSHSLLVSLITRFSCNGSCPDSLICRYIGKYAHAYSHIENTYIIHVN
uniref:Uncharacterized protein n=1 Tax=Octopus bimaculoides TaxID=37653 RepID=A0A0L8IHL6_OCTBM